MEMIVKIWSTIPISVNSVWNVILQIPIDDNTPIKTNNGNLKSHVRILQKNYSGESF